ncbi:MAG: CAP domain-containing protein [Pseudomonadota bacterium]
MGFRSVLIALTALGLAACDPAGPTGASGAGVYKISGRDAERVQQRMLESVNAMRAASGAPPLVLNAQLTSAARTHAQEMSRQRRAWPFGANGSTPYARVAAAGYQGNLLTEVYSQTYETETETLAAWVQDGAWGAEILDPAARDMGFAWQQDNSGLIWWAITLGDGSFTTAPATI